MKTKLAKDLYINERIRFDHFFVGGKMFIEYEGRVIDVIRNEDIECVAVHVLSDDGDSVWKEFDFENEIEVVIPWEPKTAKSPLSRWEWDWIQILLKKELEEFEKATHLDSFPGYGEKRKNTMKGLKDILAKVGEEMKK